jgi:acyl transferase domain-containing protein/thioesterase domain-containing protein
MSEKNNNRTSTSVEVRGYNEKRWTGSEIAVIGLSCRFPGAGNSEEYWDNLVKGKETITFFTREELISAGRSPEVVNDPCYVRASGILDDEVYQSFDDYFFQYTPKEVEMMDPQMRVYHECLYEAIEDAGYHPDTFNGAIGVYACGSPNLSWELMVAAREASNATRLFEADKLFDKDYLSTRLSYKLNLKGPSIFLFTACSSSLTALHVACQGILSGDCDMATAGGVSIVFPHKTGYPYTKGMIASPDGHCRAFDEKAAGTVRGNGAGVVLLKLLEDAINDGDHIYAIIKGSAINNDGREKVGYAAPGIQGQMNVIQTALAIACIAPEAVTYIEAHGTGTKIGDPAEIEALTKAFNTQKREYCKIGSVKTNIGHLDTAAGIAGFIKTVLMLHHKKIVPSLHFTKANPAIKFSESPFTVSTIYEDWESPGYPRTAGVSSFGIGGTNVHCILQEAPDTGKSREEKAYNIIPLSARTKTSLQRHIQNFRHFLQHNDENITDIAFTLQTGRKSYEYRKAYIVQPGNTLPEQITDALFPGNTQKESIPGRPVLFLFPGVLQSSTDILDIVRNTDCIERECEQCMNQLRRITGSGAEDFPHPGEENRVTSLEWLYQNNLDDMLLFIYEYTLARVYMQSGIAPYALYGTGVGEITAACISGMVSLNDALELLVKKSRLSYNDSPLFSRQPCTPTIPWISGQTGTWIKEKDISSPSYWENCFHFSTGTYNGLEEIAALKDAILLETRSPHTLIPLLKQNPDVKINPVIIDPVSDTYSFHTSLAQLWEVGCDIDFSLLYLDKQRKRVSLPAYPFDRKRFWRLAEESGQERKNHEEKKSRHRKKGEKETATSPAGKNITEQLNTMNEREAKEYVENKIITFWKEILGYNEVGSEDNFFESGGDSIKAMTLLSDIEKYFSLEFPLHELIENPHISSIAAYIIQTLKGNPYNYYEQNDPYVVYNRNQQPDIFCFPPYICIGLAYYEFFSFMKDFAFYCFNYLIKDNIIPFYADSITSICKKPPYILFAYSAGARVAYAVALLLEKKGYPVSDLVIMDGFVRWKTPDQFCMEKEKARAQEVLINYDHYTGVFKGNKQYMDKLLEKIIQYSKLTCEIHIKEKIHANIHLIKAEPMEKTEDNADWYEFTMNNSWKDITYNDYREYQGVAQHLDMFYPEHLERNAQIVRSVFDAVVKRENL